MCHKPNTWQVFEQRWFHPTEGLERLLVFLHVFAVISVCKSVDVSPLIAIWMANSRSYLWVTILSFVVWGKNRLKEIFCGAFGVLLGETRWQMEWSKCCATDCYPPHITWLKDQASNPHVCLFMWRIYLKMKKDNLWNNILIHSEHFFNHVSQETYNYYHNKVKNDLWLHFFWFLFDLLGNDFCHENIIALKFDGSQERLNDVLMLVVFLVQIIFFNIIQ